MTLESLKSFLPSAGLNCLPASASQRHARLWAVLGALILAVSPTRSAVTEAWVHRFTNVVSNSDDRAIKVVRDAAGDIIVLGTTAGGIPQKDILTVKYSGVNGSVLWQQRYNGPANRDDIAKALAIDGNGNVFVRGYSDTAEGTNTGYLAKYSAIDGALLWERRRDGYEDSETLLAVDANGNAVVAGISYSPAGPASSCTAKYAAGDGALLWEQHRPDRESYARAIAVDSNGNAIVTWSINFQTGSFTTKYAASDGMVLWQKRFTGSQAEAVAVDSSGNVVVTGYSFADDGPSAHTEKYAAIDGTLIWGQTFTNFYGSEGKALEVDSRGDIVVTGSLYDENNRGYFTIKYAGEDGVLRWNQLRPGALGTIPTDYIAVNPTVAVDGSGNVFVTGSVYRDFDDVLHSFSNADYYTAKYAAADGALLWEQSYNGPSNNIDHAQAIAADGSGNAIVTGYSLNSYAYNPYGGPGDYDFYTAKYAATDGGILWEQRHVGSAPSHAQANAIAVDNHGNVAVTGLALGSSDDFGSIDGGFYTAKYSATNGPLLWERRHNANGGAYAIAVDSSGNVVVTGSSYDGTNYGYTAKYAAADGTLLWEKRSEGFGEAMMLDSSGNVAVTGGSWKGNNLDYYTAKYGAADGALLWDHRYDGPAQSDDYGSAMGLDHDGNVVVTGTSTGRLVATNGYVLKIYDYYTAKYASADGALLWERRYNGPTDGSDYASAVAVDASGNVVITGSSEGDYYTAKYASTNGALLWEKRYNGPANSSDEARSVAMDGSGNVVITGNSGNHCYTAKYASADGAMLWEKRYSGPTVGSARASAVAVDASGNVVVTGTSASIGSPLEGFKTDYYTAKYAASDGELLWEKRYNGPANEDDFTAGSHCLALGPNGMVAVTGTSEFGYATVVYREVLPAVSISLLPAGVRLCFLGEPGSIYRIERAPTVTGPWSAVTTLRVPQGGVIEHLDNERLEGAAFYRASTP